MRRRLQLVARSAAQYCREQEQEQEQERWQEPWQEPWQEREQVVAVRVAVQAGGTNFRILRRAMRMKHLQ
jgi:hypothetical protein